MALETTYRDALESNTTYLVGETLEGETMLLPKQLIEQANVITINDNDNAVPEEKQAEDMSETNHLDTCNVTKREEKTVSLRDILKTPYSCEGNVVRCVTGSFD